MICPNCGINLPDDSLFCENCGTPLSASQQTVDTPPKPFVIEQPHQTTGDNSIGTQRRSSSAIGERIIKTGAIIIYVIAGCLILLRLLLIKSIYDACLFLPNQFFGDILTLDTFPHLNVLYFIYVLALFAIATAMLRMGRRGFPITDRRLLTRVSIITYAIAGFILLLRVLLVTFSYRLMVAFSYYPLNNILYFSLVIVFVVIATVVLLLSKVNN